MNATTSNGRRPIMSLMLLAACTVLFGTHRVCATDTVPFKGNAEGAIVAAAPQTAGLQVRARAEGYATQLGRFSREEEVLLGANGTVTGAFIITAANGDQLRGEVAGQFTSPSTMGGTYN